jgi:rhodanese-related sulfurtransferase
MKLLKQSKYIGLVVVVLCSTLGGYAGAMIFDRISHKDEVVLTDKEIQQKLIQDFYKIENAVSVSPHGLRKSMDSGSVSSIVVDLRSAVEYNAEHVTGAINIPAYKDPDTSAYDDIDRIVGDFKKLDQSKDIIVYCYSTACMTGRKIGKILADHGVYVKHLNIGWNEWRYDWNSWNHPHEWATTRAEDYVTSGSEPGTPTKRDSLLTCSPNTELGC